MHSPVRRAAIIAAGAALAAGGTIGVAAAAQGSPAAAVKTLTYYAFDINNSTNDPGFVPAPGTSPSAFSQGDELIINDQVTLTRKSGGGYPIVGFDSGVCTLTRVPEKFAEQTLGNCVVTAVWKGGSLTVQGAVHFKNQQPESAALAITGGTGRFNGATGTLDVTFTKDFKILTIKLK
jgi:Dirigent-like protein